MRVLRTERGAAARSSGRVEFIVVDPRPLFAHAVATVFDPVEWRVRIIAPEAVSDLPIRPGIGAVALATPDPRVAVRALAERGRKVLVYGSDEGHVFFETVDNGAVGFVSDRADAATFCGAAEELRNGAESAFPEHTRRRLVADHRDRPDEVPAFLSRLTRREREVLDGLVAGLRPAEIAERDFVSVTTVRNQVQAVLTKLDVHSQLEAVAKVNNQVAILDTGLRRIPQRGESFDASAS